MSDKSTSHDFRISYRWQAMEKTLTKLSKQTFSEWNPLIVGSLERGIQVFGDIYGGARRFSLDKDSLLRFETNGYYIFQFKNTNPNAALSWAVLCLKIIDDENQAAKKLAPVA